MIVTSYSWTPGGRQRVAWVIEATLKHNAILDVEPRSIRELSRLAGLPNHTSAARYAKGVISHPNNNGGRILRSLAPFLYRVTQFRVSAVSGEGRLIDLTFEATPEGAGDVAPWEQVPTYDFDTLAALGTVNGQRLEVLVTDAHQPEAEWLYSQIGKLEASKAGLVAKFLRVTPSTLETLYARQEELRKGEFVNLGQVIQDFLLRRTSAKPDVWDFEDLSKARGINANLSGLSPKRLEAIACEGAIAEASELSRLAVCFAFYQFPWTLEDLEVLNHCQEPTYRNAE